MMLRITNILLTLLLFSFISLSVSTCEEDTDCAENSTCSPTGEFCADFHIPNGNGCCVKMVSYGRRCEEDAQCQATLGPNALCENSTDTTLCNCKGSNVQYFNGRCYMRMEIGDTCQDDNECILGSNNDTNMLARCVDELCICGQNPMISLATHLNSDGVCVVECRDCVQIEMNLLGIMLLISSAMVVFLYLMCRILSK